MWVTQVLLSSALLQEPRKVPFSSKIQTSSCDKIDKSPRVNLTALKNLSRWKLGAFQITLCEPTAGLQPLHFIFREDRNNFRATIQKLCDKQMKTETSTLWRRTPVSWPAPLRPVLLPPYSPAKNALLQQRNGAEQLCAHSSSETGLLFCREVRGKWLYEAGEQKKVSAPLCAPFSIGKWSPLSNSPSPTATRTEDYKKRDHQLHPLPKFLYFQI